MARKRMKVGIHLTPNMAVSILIDDHIFELVAIEPYVRVDGRDSFTAHWESTCWRCAERYRVTSALRLPTINFKRTCETCRPATC